MPNVDSFMDEVVTDYRRCLALLGDGGDRRAIEDGIALLTDYRLSGMDTQRFEVLLSTLRAGSDRAEARSYRRRARAPLAGVRSRRRRCGEQLDQAVAHAHRGGERHRHV